MRLFWLFSTIFITSIYASFLDISVNQKTNYDFQEYTFVDINTTESHNKNFNKMALELDGNFNDMIGIQYTKFMLGSNEKFETKGFYFGSEEGRYLSYEEIDQKIDFTDGNRRTMNTKTDKYVLFDVLTIEKSGVNSANMENNVSYTNGVTPDGSLDSIVNRTYNKEIYKLSTEELYRKVKYYAKNKEDFFFYGLAGAKNFTPYFRLYGVVIASYEQHEYRDGLATLPDQDGNTSTTEYVKTEWGGDDTTGDNTYSNVNGKFKGWGYGYHLTAEFYYKDLSFFVTSYFKKTKLKNYHDAVKGYTPPEDPTNPNYAEGVIRTGDLTLKQQYTNFGLSYRF